MFSFFKKSNFSGWPLFLIILLILIIITGGIIIFKDQKNTFRKKAENELIAIANLKINQLTDWNRERISNAREVMDSPFVTDGIKEWMDKYPNGSPDNILVKFQSIKENYNYKNVFLTDTSGKILLNYSGNDSTLSKPIQNLLHEALMKKTSLLSDFYIEDDDTSFSLDVIAPLFKYKNGFDFENPIGAVIMRIDPAPFLFKKISSWPVPSETSEALIVRKERDSVLFISDLKHIPNRMGVKIPIRNFMIPSVNAVSGKSGIVIGKDYSGNKVLAAIFPVPTTTWFLVAKTNTNEAFQTLRIRQGITVLLAGSLVLLILITYIFIWQIINKNHEIKLYESELKRLAVEKHYETFIRYANDIILLVDSTGHILEANNKALEKYGYTKKEMTGMLFETIVDPGSLEDFKRHMAEMEKNNSFFGEIIHRKKDGKRIMVEISMRVIEIEKKKYYQAIARDISKRKLDEETLKRSEQRLAVQNEEYAALNEEYQQANEDLKRTNEELAEAKKKAELSDQLKSAFLTNMSHEIRTPMNGIVGFSQLLLSPKTSEEEKSHFVEIINASCDYLLNIINDIIDISKLETGVVTLDKSVFDVRNTIDSVYGNYKLPSERKGLSLIKKIRINEDDAVINGDEYKIKQVLVNLMDNALKFTKKGFVELGCEINDSELLFTVRDSGIGIDKKYYSAIFERFRQINNDVSIINKGTGLGLSISKSYVELMGGRIWVESKEGSGSGFFFTIPYEPVFNHSVKKHYPNHGKEYDFSMLNVLVAEDDDFNYLLVEKMLKDTGANVLRAADGSEAVKLFRSVPEINFILMDLKMPVMNGLDATREIRKKDTSVPIIAVTAYTFENEKRTTLNAGCDDYLTKPVNRLELFEKINEKMEMDLKIK